MAGQRRHGGWVYARHRNTFAAHELRWVFRSFHVSGAGDGDERPDAPLRELRRIGKVERPTLNNDEDGAGIQDQARNKISKALAKKEGR
jgi:hypothetical protein